MSNKEELYLRRFIREICGAPDVNIDDALATAQLAHLGQRRRSGEEYIEHPKEVANIVYQYYDEPALCAAALLHDTLEDAVDQGNVSTDEEMASLIAGSFGDPQLGDEILNLIRALTHHKDIPYTEYILDLASNSDALKIKLADVLHNLSSNPSPKQLQKYQNGLKALEDRFNGPPPEIDTNHWYDVKMAAGMVAESTVRKYVRRILMEASIAPGAGIIVVRQFPEGWRVLGLLSRDGDMDLPKGIIETHENAYAAAVRETKEESGIKHLDFRWGHDPLIIEHLTMYIAETSDDPCINPNPETGILEHQSAHWLTWDDMIKTCKPFLAEVVHDARSIVAS